MRWHPSRLPPAGDPLVCRLLGDAAAVWLGRSSATPPELLLAQRLALAGVRLHASGRAALASVLGDLASASARTEVVVPGYTCPSVAAAAVAAGLSVRLVDVDERGRIDEASLAALPLERTAAIVVSNLFGLPEPIARVRALAARSGAAVVDDAAQAFGARDADGLVGTRGDAGVLSFGRGKPLSALGGGAELRAAPFSDVDAASGSRRGGAVPLAAVVRAFAYDVALVGPVFRALAAIPALHIGETVFEPAIARGPIAPHSRSLLHSALLRADADAGRRAAEARRLAERVAAETDFVPLLAPAGDGTAGVYPRLGLLAPTPERRDAAFAALTRLGAGASGFYPSSLDRIEAVRPHLAAPADCPGAQRLASRVLTLPTHGRLRGRRLEAALALLAGAAR